MWEFSKCFTKGIFFPVSWRSGRMGWVLWLRCCIIESDFFAVFLVAGANLCVAPLLEGIVLFIGSSRFLPSSLSLSLSVFLISYLSLLFYPALNLFINLNLSIFVSFPLFLLRLISPSFFLSWILYLFLSKMSSLTNSLALFNSTWPDYLLNPFND